MQRPWLASFPRRTFVVRSLGTLASAALAACGWAHRTMGMQTAPQSLPSRVFAATPACGDSEHSDTTPEQTEGPYFKPSSPERASLLEDGVVGDRLVLTGTVVTTDCTPVAHALLDFWQADGAGQYDNTGFRLRGHQYTDDAGRFALETVVPGLYPGRTRHIHVKVQAPNGPVLTTQLYFPNEQRNARDGIFDPNLVMDVQDAADGNGKQATFTFVVTPQTAAVP